MTLFNFPNSPIDGQTYTPVNGLTYVWHAPTWMLQTVAGFSDAPNDGNTYGRKNSAWLQVLPLSGGTITGPLTTTGGISSGGTIVGITLAAGNNGTVNPSLIINGASGGDRQILFDTNSVPRWVVTTNGATESGGNTGSDFAINRFNDAGLSTGTALSISRSTGAVSIAQGLTAGTLTSASAVSAGSAIRTTGGRVISQGAGNPSACVYDSAQSYSAGMFLGSSKNLYFGVMDTNGSYIGPELGHFDTAGNFSVIGRVQATTDMYAGGFVYINYPAVSDFIITRSGGNRTFQWAGGWYDGWHESDGMRSWICNNIVCMTLDGIGNLVTVNNMTSLQWICKTNPSFNLAPGGGPAIIFASSTHIQYAQNLNIVAVTSPGQNITMIANGALTLNQPGAFKPGGGPWTDTSDIRIKRVTGNYTRGLAEILKLEPRRAVFLGNDIHVTQENLAAHAKTRDTDTEVQPLVSHHAEVAETEQEFICFVAQEAEEAMPELVSHVHGTIDGEFVEDLRVVDTQPLFYTMINAFKEIDARLRAVEERA